jgi:hypothetical protein
MGDLAEVAFVRDEFEAEMIRVLLDGHGIPSIQEQVTPSGPQVGYGLMNPGGGARRVMVHAERAERARVLIEAAMAEAPGPEPVNAESGRSRKGTRPTQLRADRRLRPSLLLVVRGACPGLRRLDALSRPLRPAQTVTGPRTISRR